MKFSDDDDFEIIKSDSMNSISPESFSNSFEDDLFL